MNTSALRRAAGAIATALIALLLAACGGDNTTLAAPTIAAFSATPAALPAGGGSVQLSWTTVGASQLSIDNGVGDVSGLANKTIMVTAGTTFTLTATNDTGTATATTTVTVAAATAPTIASFTATPATLPAGGGSTTLGWTTAGATSLSIDNGVGDVSGATSKAVNVAASTTFTLTATNAVGSVTRTTAVAIVSAADRFVDSVNGSDSNPCTQALPCKSIFQSLTGAPAGSTLALADGMYSQASEGHFEIGVPDGVTLIATHPGAVTLADVDLFLHGSATLDGVAFGMSGPPGSNTCASISASGGATTTYTVTLNGVFSNCSRWLGLGPNMKAVMTPGALPGGVYTTGFGNGNTAAWINLVGNAELLIQGGILEGNGTGAAYPQVGLLNVAAGAKLTLDGVTVKDWPQAAIATSGTVIVQNGTLIDHVGAAGDPGPLSTLSLCDTNSAILVGGAAGQLTIDHSTLSNIASGGICVLDTFITPNTLSINIVQSTIANVAGPAIESHTGQSAPDYGGTVIIAGSSFTNNGRAIFWLGRPGTNFDISNTTITGSTGAANVGATTEVCAGAAIRVDMFTDAGTFKLRGSTVSGNAAEGVCLLGAVTADAGTQADPGGNTLAGNTLAGLRVVSDGGQLTVNAVGNLWIASQQGADANGRYSVAPGYTPVPKTGPQSGANFKLDNVLSAANL